MNPSASCSSTENSAENSPSFNSDNRTSMTYPLYPTLLFMTATSAASIIALRVGSFLSSQCRPPVISQSSQQPRVPPLRSVVADRDAPCLLLPDQHEQSLAPRDARVDKVALQQHVVLGRKRDDDCRELRSLRLVDRDRVSQRNLVQFSKVVLDQPLVEAHCNLLLHGVDSLDDPHVAVEHVLVVVVL